MQASPQDLSISEEMTEFTHFRIKLGCASQQRKTYHPFTPSGCSALSTEE